MNETLDIGSFRSWIGNEEKAVDIVTLELVKRFHATFDQTAGNSQSPNLVPLAIHWCLAPSVVQISDLGPDGHPRRGGFLPPIPLPRRMWVGGDLVLSRSLWVGDSVHRVSRIEDIRLKEGQSGPLCFVSVRHEFSVDDKMAVVERQDIVYRGLETGATEARGKRVAKYASNPQWRRSIDVSSILLFRYSALTFNCHRIHYDHRYCVGQEGYPGLVVHGPLQASLLLHFASEIRGGTAPQKFSFRSVAPIFDETTFSLNAADAGSALQLWTADASGCAAMIAEASW
jgi:3-methylfumaryl-CoA hydratase